MVISGGDKQILKVFAPIKIIQKRIQKADLDIKYFRTFVQQQQGRLSNAVGPWNAEHHIAV
jgi:hypothetical protein